MGFVNTAPEDEYRLNSVGQNNPITNLQADGWADGMLSAVPRGLTSAFLKTNSALNSAMAPVDSYLGLTDFNKQTSVDISDSIEKFAKGTDTVQGSGAQMLSGISEGLGLATAGSLMGGPMGAALLLGGVEGHSTYEEMKAQGVDTNTALKAAGISGVTNAAGVFLPMTVSKGAVTALLGKAMSAEVAGNTALSKALYTSAEFMAPLADKLPATLAVGAGANAGAGIAQRFLTSEVLEEGGHADLAKQYRPFDTAAVVADTILGMAFGGLAHYGPKLSGKMAEFREQVNPSDVDAAMAVLKQMHEERSGLGIPDSPLSANTHSEVLDRSINDLINGRDPSLTSEETKILTDQVVADPSHGEFASNIKDIVGDVFDAHSEMDAPVLRKEAEVNAETQAKLQAKADAMAAEGTVAPAPVAPNAKGEPPAKMAPMVEETLDQLVAKHGDMPITLSDGRQVTLDQMRGLMAENMSKAQSDSLLHDVAAACFVRTSL